MSAADESPAKMVLYQAGDGSVRVECRFYNETLWLSLNEIAELFGRDKSVISKHLKNIFEEGELAREGTVANYATVQLAYAGKISAEQAKAKAELEYDRYRRVLDAQPCAVDNDLAEAIKKLPRRKN